MIDLQSTGDTRGIPIPRVGVSNLRHQVTTGDREWVRAVVAEVNMSVGLSSDRRGTHMSRLVEVLTEHADDLTVGSLPVAAKRLTEHLDADSGRIEIRFPLVVDSVSPVTQQRSQNVHDALLAVQITERELSLAVGVTVVSTSLCPCSKAISDYGAHNQRTRVSIEVTAIGSDAPLRLPRLRNLVHWAEGACSSPTYPLLKRSDERHVTMHAYDNPVFVEDIVRSLAADCTANPGPGRYHIRARNEESIHRHDAIAEVWGDLG